MSRIPRTLYSDDKSVVLRFSPVLGQSDERSVENEVRSMLGRPRVAVTFHHVDRDATIVVGHVRDSY